MNFKKYKPYASIEKRDRRWPNNKITKAPIWCSVDLRDGNQALEIPMNLQQKVEYFNYLVKIGFKQIEVAFPAASDTEFEFVRTLIEQNLIPDDVIIQVLTQSREHIIRRTFESLKGAKQAIVHLYNSTSTLQRDVVFGFSREQTVELAVSGAKLMNECKEEFKDTNFTFQYSPESFTGTEMDFAVKICNSVIDVWKPTSENKVIINLPSTVEMSTPNVYADQIEYMNENLIYRDDVIISVHAHNDRGCGVAATELAMLAGCDRVEGTLFGNGERTGNADIVSLALNMFSQGIDPLLDFSDIDKAIELYERTMGLPVHPRHPYAGDLVFTAFSGSHQDAIKKGMERISKGAEIWEVPYLPIDPKDVGKSYGPIIRINSQSGKGGVSYILESAFGLKLPKPFLQDFGKQITNASDKGQKELLPKDIYELFDMEYINIKTPLELIWYEETVIGNKNVKIAADLMYNGENVKIAGQGQGLLDAFIHALEELVNIKIEVVDYNEHSMEQGKESRAITYMEIGNGKRYYGAGISSSISKSSLRALISAVNKQITDK